MRKVLEAQAPTSAEAIQQALQRLGVSESEVFIEVLDEGVDSPLCRRPASIRVTHDLSRTLIAEAQTAVATEVARPAVQAPRSSPAVDRAIPAARETRSPVPRETLRDPLPEPRAFVAVDETSDPIGEARTVVAKILRLLDIDATVDAFEDDDRIQISIESDAGGLLIGKNGKNIDALQHIVNRIVNRGNRDRATVVLDTEDYRRRRRESLEDLAFRVADRVRDSGRRVMLQELNPHDRRIVHLALRDDPDVETESDGDGFLKRIFVQPSAPSRPSARGRGERRPSR